MKRADQRPVTPEYTPYEAFWEGFIDYQHGQHRNPYAGLKNGVVEAQAWGSGQEAALRARATGR